MGTKTKKFLVIGNPIEHSLSPKIHNYWIKKNNIDAVYDKQKLSNDNLKNFVAKAALVSGEHPILIDAFLEDAYE